MHNDRSAPGKSCPGHDSEISGQQPERLTVRQEYAEVPLVEGQDIENLMPLGEDHDRSIGKADLEVSVFLDNATCSPDVLGVEWVGR